MIGVIGFGRFGRLTIENLAVDFPVLVHTRDTEKAKAIIEAGGRPASLADVCTQKAVIICVPISAMQATLKEIAGLVAPGTTVIDVCSVKVYPVQWMQELLPESAEILATHPMFGPDSAADTIKGQKIVLCPVRIAPQRYQKIVQWLDSQGVERIETTPEEHDQKISVSLALTHFIGRSLSDLKAGPLEIDTEGYKRLLHILDVVTNDTWQLFEDMHHYNPYAKKTRQTFIEAITKINSQLEK